MEKHFQAVVNHALLTAPLAVSMACKASFFSFSYCSFTKMALFLFCFGFFNHPREECCILLSLSTTAPYLYKKILKSYHERNIRCCFAFQLRLFVGASKRSFES